LGTGAPDAVQQLARIPEVRVIGAVPDLTPWYRDADAVVVPLRAGGGTRIKVLEAFSFRRPVVSTSLGVEGIDVVPDEHVLLGDSPDELAMQCQRLMDDRHLGEMLVERAYALLVSAYSKDAQARALAAVS
jgi:glycosyltransferase involved in cell wall biosynthesis